MKTVASSSSLKTLTSLSLVLAAGSPVALLALLAGVSLPASLTAAAFGVFCAALTLATVVGDYATRRPALALGLARAATSSVAPTLATEDRRLAA